MTPTSYEVLLNGDVISSPPKNELKISVKRGDIDSLQGEAADSTTEARMRGLAAPHSRPMRR
eukprot:10004983-Lingulodinium_polyedra.AAC.1